jgi:hypothetical protein
VGHLEGGLTCPIRTRADAQTRGRHQNMSLINRLLGQKTVTSLDLKGVTSTTSGFEVRRGGSACRRPDAAGVALGGRLAGARTACAGQRRA